ncbi:hypothetical protein MBLNU457_g2426t1 [Dothideomycetes sp. NU457]
MPPKRKSRPSTRTTTPAASSPLAAEPSPAPQATTSPSPSPSHTAAERTLLSSWTTPQETGLFKALIKYKPTGIHKHVRMLSIRSYLLSNGYIHPSAPHTRIAGLWLKVSTLYDLKALDQREDSVDEDLHPEYDDDESGPEGDDEDEDEDEEKQAWRDLVDFRGHAGFELDVHDGFEALMWRRRFVEDEGKARKRRRSSSPALPELLDREVPVRFVPSFGVGKEDEEDGGRIRVARGRGGRAARGGRESLRRGRVQDSVAESEEPEGDEEGEQEEDEEGDEEDEDEEGEGEDEEENEDEEEDEEEESEEQESSEEQEETTAPATRGRGGRGRGAAATRGRGRAGRRRGR